MYKILHVEDDPLDRLFTKRALSELDLGIVYVELTDGLSLISYLAENPHQDIRLAILDYNMPRLSGLATLKQLRQNNLLGKFPVVILSSSRITEDVDAAYRAGATAFVSKPGNYKKFNEVIKGIGTFWCKYNETTHLPS